MILNLWMESTLHVMVVKNTSLSCIFPSFEAAHFNYKVCNSVCFSQREKKERKKKSHLLEL